MSVDTPAQKPAPGAAPARPPAPRPSAWSALRPVVLRLHFYAGLLVAPFLLVAAVTGGLYAASYQIERVVYADELYVPGGGTVLPLDQQVDAALDAYPQGTLTAVWPSAGPGATTRVLMDHPTAPEGRALAVFVDPHTADVTGDLASYGSSGALPFRAWISEFHAGLGLGDPGRFYSELAASWLWAVVLGGLALWLTRRRAARKLRGTKGRRRTLAVHGTVGVWVALGLLVLSATGLTWSQLAGGNVGDLRSQLGGTTPSIHIGGGEHAGHEGHAGDGGGTSGHDTSGVREHVSLEHVLTTARTQEGLTGPVAITVPAPDGAGPAAYVVKQTDAQVPQRMDQVAVDATSGEVTGRLDFADYPLLAKLTSWGISLHDGKLFGLANQIALFAVAAGLVVLILWGYAMWWNRRSGQAPRYAVGRPYPRGGLPRTPPRVLLPLLAAAALAGWFVPLLGLSLLAFLAVDTGLGALARRHGRNSA
ncbi:PepSY-associated TM helix domain-containing protein [Streptomyces sp. TRM 70351]|uniref:PepSY-associated TM helix domain-containing protein n=1 Tax=Streptomyces sp. TRM 70351 TaxID=3116552 RepID=UPI002E7C0465|nr:PepSY-associated TM helix domain-containing protein [Streptomyces sp. TRM 70351]MEE1928623.1 PepSY-associated TM helix domain-containing protein [Streptomyces sp. TRM 70351]